MTSHPILRKRKRELPEDLQSTADSHPMSGPSDYTNPKRARTLTDDVDIVKYVNSSGLYMIFYNLLGARHYEAPYEDHRLGWENDELWEIVVKNCDLGIVMSVDDVKKLVSHYYDKHVREDLPSHIKPNLKALISDVFLQRERDHVGKFCNTYCCPRPIPLAIRLGPTSSSTLSHDYGPGESGPGHHIYAHHTHTYTRPSLGYMYVDKLMQLQDKVSAEEYSWASLHMSKYNTQVEMFLAYDDTQRVQLLKEGYEDWRIGKFAVTRHPESD